MSHSHNDRQGCRSDGYDDPDDARAREESAIFKEYQLPNGQSIKLTKDEFDRVVDLFRLLLYQESKMKESERTQT